jgi:hypothetical protein
VRIRHRGKKSWLGVWKACGAWRKRLGRKVQYVMDKTCIGPANVSRIAASRNRKRAEEFSRLGAISSDCDYVFVTAYVGLQRESWNSYARGSDVYCERFSRLLKMQIPLIAYVDVAVYGVVAEMALTRPDTLIIPVDEEFLINNLRGWSYLCLERDLMHGRKFRRMTAHRRSSPSCHNPRYTCLTHCKTDFLLHAAVNECPSAQYLGWVDFGYVRYPSTLTGDLSFEP